MIPEVLNGIVSSIRPSTKLSDNNKIKFSVRHNDKNIMD